MDYSVTNLPQEYVEKYIHSYVGYVKKNRYKNIFQGGCPICREGSSWGKKARFYYFGDEDRVMCHNCGYSKNTRMFIHEVSGLSYQEIEKESKDYDLIPLDLKKSLSGMDFSVKSVTETLPKDSINLFDKNQVNFYKDNKIVRLALMFIKKRRLLTAVNAPKAFYISLDDFTHANRLIIPYYGEDNKILSYQTRKLVDDDSPKYLSKKDCDKSLYGINKIDPDIPYIFVFEGAIDAMFVKNAVCVSGIQEKGDLLFTELQRQQIRQYPFHEIIWVLDSPILDKAARLKNDNLLGQNQKVFEWPEKLARHYKDINEICIDKKLDEIPYKFFAGNIIKDKLHNLIKSRLT